MKRLLFLFVMFVTALTMHAQRYAVLEFQAAKGISISDVDGISDMFLTYFNPQGYSGVDRGQINKVLSEQNLQHSDVTETIAVRIGRIMNVSKVVLGKVSRLGGGYQVDVRVVDVESARIYAKDGETLRGDFRAGVSALAKRLASKIAIRQSNPVPARTATPTNSSENSIQKRKEQLHNIGYVDLGLPSGTWWRDQDENASVMTTEKAVEYYGNKIPTAKQCKELIDECKWSWTGSQYRVTGPNGNSIKFSARGWSSDGTIYRKGRGGSYITSDVDYMNLLFDGEDNSVFMGETGDRSPADGFVRLVQKP